VQAAQVKMWITDKEQWQAADSLRDMSQARIDLFDKD